jgi:hypothetical protein
MDNKANEVCCFLRARNPFGMMEGGEHPWRFMDDANTIYWCIKSAGAAGPDNGLVGINNCIAGRSCYKSMDSINE